MPALNRRPAETPAPEAPRTIAPVAPAAAHRPRASAPRELRDLLEARLAAPSPAHVTARKFSPIVRVGIVALLAGLAWTPIAAAAYFSLIM